MNRKRRLKQKKWHIRNNARKLIKRKIRDEIKKNKKRMQQTYYRPSKNYVYDKKKF